MDWSCSLAASSIGWASCWLEPLRLHIRETADAMVSTGLAAVEYEYINLDDCWGNLYRDAQEILRFNLCWKRILVLLTLWVLLHLLQIIKKHTTLCRTMCWMLIILQFPVTFIVFGYEAVKLYKESKKRRSNENNESVCGATIQWTHPKLFFALSVAS